jgi:hypothetical protein
MPTPYGESSLIDTSVNLSKERSMTMQQFKERFLKPKLKRRNERSALRASSAEADQYLDWLGDEEAKDERARWRFYEFRRSML